MKFDRRISRRSFLAAAGVSAAALALTACGGSSSTAASAAGSTAASGDTIKVGVLGPLTGDVSVYGQAVVNGAALYMKQVNEKGGVNGKQLEIIAMDEQGPEKINAFLKMFSGYDILELCRTGITALERGGKHPHMQKPPQEVRAAQLPLPGTHCPQDEE